MQMEMLSAIRMREELRDLKDQICQYGFVRFDLPGKGLFLSDAPRYMDEILLRELCELWQDAGYEIEIRSKLISVSPGDMHIHRFVKEIEERNLLNQYMAYLPKRFLMHCAIQLTDAGKRLVWEALRTQRKTDLLPGSEPLLRKFSALNMRKGDYSGQYEAGVFILEQGRCFVQ